MKRIFIAAKSGIDGPWHLLGPFSNFRKAYDACVEWLEGNNVDVVTTYGQAQRQCAKTGTSDIETKADLWCRIQEFELNRIGRHIP